MLLAAVLVKPTAVGKAVGEEAGVRAGCMRVDRQASAGVLGVRAHVHEGRSAL